jgi:O-acetyl-ADP-ribose deacetylase (regulator of RNase III)
MIQVFKGNLFDYLTPITEDESSVHFIIHGCNAQGRMGTGFAKELRRRFPSAYHEYDKAYSDGNNHLKVGSVIYHAESTNLIICNAVTQEYYGRDGAKYVSYDAIDNVFIDLDNTASLLKKLSGIRDVHFHFPKIGSDLGGGNWNVIAEIIDSRVTNATKNLYEL